VEEQNPGGRTGAQQIKYRHRSRFTYATKGGTPARLGYYDNYLVDNDSCVIVGVQATAARMSQETVARQNMLTVSRSGKGRAPESVAPTRPTERRVLQWLADRSITPTCGP